MRWLNPFSSSSFPYPPWGATVTLTLTLALPWLSFFCRFLLLIGIEVYVVEYTLLVLLSKSRRPPRIKLTPSPQYETRHTWPGFASPSPPSPPGDSIVFVAVVAVIRGAGACVHVCAIELVPPAGGEGAGGGYGLVRCCCCCWRRGGGGGGIDKV